jgi:hypothetical protein
MSGLWAPRRTSISSWRGSSVTREQAQRARPGDAVWFLGRAGDTGFVLASSRVQVKVRWPSGVEQAFMGERLRSIEPARPVVGAFTWMRSYGL